MSLIDNRRLTPATTLHCSEHKHNGHPGKLTLGLNSEKKKKGHRIAQFYQINCYSVMRWGLTMVGTTCQFNYIGL